MLKKRKSGIVSATVLALILGTFAITSPADAGGRNWNKGNWNRGHWNNNNWNRGNWNGGWNNYWVAPAIGLGTGLLFGAIMAQPRYAPSYAPAPYYGNRNASRNSPYAAKCSEARAQHGENSAEAATFC